MIKLNGISKEFREGINSKKVKALDDLTLNVRRGEVFGFLGPNGAGKSTAIKILVNLIRADKGNASIMDRDVNDTGVRKNIGYLPENPYFYDYLTAEELLWFGGKTSGLSSRTIKERSDELFEQVNLQSARKRQLLHDPDVAIFDEPMSGLDPLGRKMVGDIILELKSRGKTIFFSSHILTDIEKFCDKVGIIVAGKLRLVGGLSDVLAGNANLEEVFLKEVEKAGGGMEI